MTITIAPDDTYLPASRDVPVVGRTYALEPADTPTAKQNATFHALVDCYFVSGMWSYQGSGYKQGATYTEFRNAIKYKLGVGFESYDYADLIDGRVHIFRDVQKGDIPPHVWANYRLAVRGNLKSWSDYTKKERTETIDKLIAEMISVGVSTPKFQEIMRGLEEGKTA